MAAEDHVLTSSSGLRIKWTFIVTNVIFFVASFALLGIGIWVSLENNLVSIVFEIVGQQNKMRAPIFLVTIGAATVALLSFIGGYGAYKEMKFVIMGYVIGAVSIFIIVVVGAILSLVSQSQIDDRVRAIMRETLVKDYGYDTFITNTWNYAQVSLYCCGVEDASWNVYRSSEWYYNQPGDIEERPLVPPSCCVQDQYGEVFNMEQCQRYMAGPPRKTHGKNDALRHRGCYTVAQERTHTYALAVAVIGFMLAICMIIGMVEDVILISLMKRSEG